MILTAWILLVISVVQILFGIYVNGKVFRMNQEAGSTVYRITKQRSMINWFSIILFALCVGFLFGGGY